MAIEIKSTSSVTVNGVKVVIYGASGVGKTTLAATAPRPIILSAESGLLSLKKFNIPFIEIKNYNDLVEAYKWIIGSVESKQFDTLYLDSFTEIGEVVLADLKANAKDPRQAYLGVQEQMVALARTFRDMKEKHVGFICKEEVLRDTITGLTTYRPMMPGSKLPEQVPYFFDEVFQYYIYREQKDNTEIRALRTKANVGVVAKDRSGLLDEWERPNLTDIFNKIIHG